MPFASGTTNYFPNVVTSTSLNIPFSDLDSIANSAEATDIREVVYSILNKVADVYIPLVTADKTNTMSISRSTSMVDSDTIRKTFTVSMLLDANNITVVDN